MTPRRRHPLRRWWVYCLIAWALATTTVGHAVVGVTLTLLAQAWLRELVLLVALAALASWIACSTWRAGRRPRVVSRRSLGARAKGAGTHATARAVARRVVRSRRPAARFAGFRPPGRGADARRLVVRRARR